MNLDKIANLCRLCLAETKNLIDTSVKENWLEIMAQHFYFMPINEENISHKVCDMCWSKTYEFHKFYTTVKKAQHKFRDRKRKRLPDLFTEDIQVKSESNVQSYELPNIDVKIDNADETLQNTESEGVNFKYVGHLNVIQNDGNRPNISAKKIASQSTKQRTDSKNPRKLNKETVDEQIREYFRMECNLCNKTFSTFMETQRHYRDEHHQTGYITCCERKFYDRRRIVAHIRRHVNPREGFTCDICNRTSPCKDSLKSHMAIHIPNHLKPYQCGKCPKRFVTKYKLKHHNDLKHSEERDKNVVCPDCGKKFLLDSMLKLHIKTVHSNVQICDICAKQFKNKYSLASHQKEVHTNDLSLQIKCDLCGTVLKNQICLKQHMRYHNDVPRECSICGKVYPNKNALNSHVRYVHKEKNFQCTMCEKSFKVAIQLKNHMPSHTGQSIYNCPYCPETYRSHGNFYHHRKRHHFDEWMRDRKGKRGSGISVKSVD